MALGAAALNSDSAAAVRPHHRLEVQLAGAVDDLRQIVDLAGLEPGDALEQQPALALAGDERLAHLDGERKRGDHIDHRGVHHRVEHREQAEREQLGAAGDPERLAGELAEAGADERGDGELRRLVVDAREHAERRPALDVLEAEQRERLTDRPDVTAQAEERRVDVAKQPEAERDVVDDQLLDLLELNVGIVEHRGHLEQREPVGGDAAGARDRRPAEEVALEQIASGVDAELVIGLGREFLGDELSLVRLSRWTSSLSCSRPSSSMLSLTTSNSSISCLGPFAVAEVVERELVPLLLSSRSAVSISSSNCSVSGISRPTRPDGSAWARPPVTNSREMLTHAVRVPTSRPEVELGERVQDHGGGGALGVGDHRHVVGVTLAAEQQLVADNLELGLKMGWRATNASGMRDPENCRS